MGQAADYPAFKKIDGRHPFKSAVPGGFVDYGARRMRGAEIIYFNFALAREMGLIPAGHPDRLNPKLRRAVLDAFALTIVNEYDLENETPIPERDRLPQTYMATRYLQLQHPGRVGKGSGDGRSVWNGMFSRRGVTWDISSCGTGVTQLCPATAEQQRFFKTGNWQADYGCGTATVEEGLTSALMSETLHRNGLATERVLVVLRMASGFAVNVRAGRNLLRPSHFFVHSKQNRLERLRGVAECFIRRQVANGAFPELPDGAGRYRFLAEEMSRTFARLAATFEREYIFCWLDWDGDNILADGGIIDYGSVRQLGLYHREYRFDDGPRWSTSLPEQRRKARLIVQNFAQVRQFLITGRRPPLRSLRHDPILALFDEEFERTRLRLLLRNIGFDAELQEALLDHERSRIEGFQRVHTWFEHGRSARGPIKVGDGVTWNAIFSTRDLLRELPDRYLEEYAPLPARKFLDIALSTFASRNDRRLTPNRERRAREFQRCYFDLLEAAARRHDTPVPLLLTEIAGRSTIINRYDRITGDSVLYAARKLTRHRKRLGPERLYEILRAFVHHQTLVPELRPPAPKAIQHPDARRIFDQLIGLVEELRYGH